MLFCFYLFCLLSPAKVEEKPEKYHWVVELSYYPQYETQIRFYKNGSQLVYEKKLVNVLIDIRRKNVRRKLNKLLKAYINNPEKFIITPADSNFQY